MAAQVGGKELQKHRIFKEEDILPLPWDKDRTAPPDSPISEDEAKRLRDIMKANPFLMFGDESISKP